MSYAALATPMLWPPYMDSTSTLANYLIDASAEKVMQILRVPLTGTLDGFEIKLGTVTQAPVNGLKFSFQNVDSSSVPAVPDGTADQSSTVTVGITTGAWLASGSMPRSVTEGDIIACVVEFASFSASDSLNIQRQSSIDLMASMPYSGLYTASWAMQASSLSMALRYDGGIYVPVLGVAPWIVAITSTGNVNTGTTPDEVALRVNLPFGAKSTGFIVDLDSDNAVDVVLYDGTTALATTTITPNLRHAGSGLILTGYWPTKQTLAAGSYRVAVKPTSASSITARYLEVNSAALMAAAPGGAEHYYSYRTDAGAWSDTTTRRLVAQLLISDIDSGSAGGLMRHPGMTGGILG